MPDKFNRPTQPDHAIYHDVLCGNIERVLRAVAESPDLIYGKPTVAGAWSHGGRRCAAQDDVIACLHLIAKAGAAFELLGPGTFDSAFKIFPRAARLLFDYGAVATSTGDDGETGLHAMAAIGYRTAARFLIGRGADVNANAKDGATPLDVAVALKLPRMVQFLRELGGKTQLCDPNDALDYDVPEPLHPDDTHLLGSVLWYRSDRGYGYLRDTNDNRDAAYGDLFFDQKDCSSSLPPAVEEGTPVCFTVGDDQFGIYAKELRFTAS